MSAVIIRDAMPADATALLEIYRPYVEETAISFEYVVPDEAEFRQRMETVLETYPYLIAERDGEPVGYTYAGRFHPRKAYDLSAEASIYLRRDCRGAGLGPRLYAALESALRAQGVTNLYACIAYADPEDEYLKNDSPRFHEHMGYKTVGRFHACGHKFGRWYDMVWMEKMLAGHETPGELKRYRDIKCKIV